MVRAGDVTEIATGLDAVARRGELTALVGPNGAGKSTLLRTLCGLQPALRGQVLIDGDEVSSIRPADLATRISDVLTERIDPGLLMVRELVALGRTPHLPASARLSPEDDAAVEWALDAVGATRLASQQFSELSDGQRQRTLTARAPHRTHRYWCWTSRRRFSMCRPGSNSSTCFDSSPANRISP
jgi:iron complex transport system ATP-binding protein